VSLEDFESVVEEPVEAVFGPEEAGGKTPVTVSLDPEQEPPDAIVDGKIDLGALALEFLTLALDPYPRKPDVAFVGGQDAKDAAEVSPFAALAALKKGEGPK
jgi:hypothetical protein